MKIDQKIPRCSHLALQAADSREGHAVTRMAHRFRFVVSMPRLGEGVAVWRGALGGIEDLNRIRFTAAIFPAPPMAIGRGDCAAGSLVIRRLSSSANPGRQNRQRGRDFARQGPD